MIIIYTCMLVGHFHVTCLFNENCRQPLMAFRFASAIRLNLFLYFCFMFVVRYYYESIFELLVLLEQKDDLQLCLEMIHNCTSPLGSFLGSSSATRKTSSHLWCRIHKYFLFVRLDRMLNIKACEKCICISLQNRNF